MDDDYGKIMSGKDSIAGDSNDEKWKRRYYTTKRKVNASRSPLGNSKRYWH